MSFQASRMKKIGHLLWLILTLFYTLLISIHRSNAASNHELNEELRFIHQEIGLLRDENHHQNMEIALLKERAGNTKDSDDQTMIADHLQSGDNFRNKRPVRLLPQRILYGERSRDEIEQQKQIERRRFEQPSNCSDLSILGYTLNGFYTVKSNESSVKSNSTNNDTTLETVYCAFKQPEGKFDQALVEKRIITRRETSTKPSNKMVFQATRKTDLLAGSGQFTITFEKVLPNLGDAFNAKTGMFIAPISGLYLFIFRGLVTFPEQNLNREFDIILGNYYPRQLEKAQLIGMSIVRDFKESIYVEFDKVHKANRGDLIHVDALFHESDAKFTGTNTSFTAYLMEK